MLLEDLAQSEDAVVLVLLLELPKEIVEEILRLLNWRYLE